MTTAIQKSAPGDVTRAEDQFLSLVERMASNPEVDVAKLSAILDMQERILNKRAEVEFNEAFARLSGKLPRIRKRGEAKNKTQIMYRYARWEDIDQQIRPLLDEEGFALSFNTRPMEGASGIVVSGTLAHKSGHSRSAEIPLPIDMSGAKNGIQGMGSTFSYGKRYTATMLLNITVEDEDNDATAPPQGFITADQKSELVALMQEVSANTKGFLDFFNVQSLDELPAARFTQARGMLASKRKKAPAQ